MASHAVAGNSRGSTGLASNLKQLPDLTTLHGWRGGCALTFKSLRISSRPPIRGRTAETSTDAVAWRLDRIGPRARRGAPRCATLARAGKLASGKAPRRRSMDIGVSVQGRQPSSPQRGTPRDTTGQACQEPYLEARTHHGSKAAAAAAAAGRYLDTCVQYIYSSVQRPTADTA